MWFKDITRACEHSHIENGYLKSGQEIINKITPVVWICQLISSAMKNVRIIWSLESQKCDY
jgi:hypothetical protein